MTVTQTKYDAGTAAALKLIRQDVQTMVPGLFRGMIPADKEPPFAEAIAKAVLDAADKVT